MLNQKKQPDALQIPKQADAVAQTLIDAVRVDLDCRAGEDTTSVHLSHIPLGSQISIDGPESDMFVVTDDSIDLTFAAPGLYRLRLSTPAPDDSHVDFEICAVHATAAARRAPP